MPLYVVIWNKSKNDQEGKYFEQGGWKKSDIQILEFY